MSLMEKFARTSLIKNVPKIKKVARVNLIYPKMKNSYASQLLLHTQATT